MGPESSLPHSQVPAICPCFEPLCWNVRLKSQIPCFKFPSVFVTLKSFQKIYLSISFQLHECPVILFVDFTLSIEAVQDNSVQWGMLQWTVFINEIRMLQRIQMLQPTQRNTIGRRSTRVRMTCRAFPLWLDRQSSSLLSFVRLSYQFSS